MIKSLVQSSFKQFGLRVSRDRPPNRFQAMRETLLLLRSLDYKPRVVIDGGANVGQWTQDTRDVFPNAEFHLVEPQTACAESLKNLAAHDQNMSIHLFALTRSGIDRVRMIGGGSDGRSPGGHIASDDTICNDEQFVRATTLDQLFADQLGAKQRTLLKLDLEGHELEALEGATQLLPNIEVIVTEFQFYEVQNNGCPVFADVLNYLQNRGFALYDFACLSQRARDMRLRMGDAVFVNQTSPLWSDVSWE